jgi:hypothetical protein
MYAHALSAVEVAGLSAVPEARAYLLFGAAAIGSAAICWRRAPRHRGDAG